VNTGNPGSLHLISWPKSNRDPVDGRSTRNPYGSCLGRNSLSCAWQYGWDMASLDWSRRGVSGPANFMWWLDVEITNSWQQWLAANRADLEGMVTYLQDHRVRTGIYSTPDQWRLILGRLPNGSRLRGLPVWLAGAKTFRDARQNCHQPAFDGGVVVFTQWRAKAQRFDSDYPCLKQIP